LHRAARSCCAATHDRGDCPYRASPQAGGITPRPVGGPVRAPSAAPVRRRPDAERSGQRALWFALPRGSARPGRPGRDAPLRGGKRARHAAKTAAVADSVAPPLGPRAAHNRPPPRSAGVARGGAVPRERWSARGAGGFGGQPRPCALGARRWAGNGNGRRSPPRMTLRTGGRRGCAFAWRSNSSGRERPWSVPTNGIFLGCPRVGLRGCPRGTTARGGRRAPLRSALWPAPWT
jgi:hypothetical protein